MTPRLETIEQIFHAALEREPDDVAAFLAERSAGDESLRRAVVRLLASHRQARRFIETPIVSIDASLFEDESPDRLTGRTLGHYEIVKRIGGGGMGVVYLARRADRQYEKLVAIKLIKRGMDTEAVLRHFRSERQILASLDHPNIARLLDGDTTEEGLPYFVMEYVEGAPIDEYCDRERLSVTQRLELFLQVCGAVSYAHHRAVIHRDIKPSNILVGADAVPKLLDFGIAKVLSSTAGDEPAATMIGLHVMTPEYASPEQVRGAPATTVSDVYSLGVVLYRLLTGRLPYRLPGEKSGDVAHTAGETEPPRPSAVVDASIDAGRHSGRQLRGDLDNIVLMALRKEPERRYQSVEQFSDDIRRHLATLPVLARPDTFAYRGVKFVRRNAALTAAAALVALSLIGGIVATTWQARKARAQEAIAKAEKSRAERRFNEVRQLAHAVLFDYHDAIKDLSGATAVRERLLKDGLAYLDSLAGEASGDVDLQRELADAYERLGDVRGQTYSAASLGDPAGARESYTKALRIREALVAARPSDTQSRRDLARSYVRLGTGMVETSEAARGMQYLRDALTIYHDLAAEQPADAQVRYELAAAHNYLGLALEDFGDASGALANQRKALALREQLVVAEPANQKYRRDLSVTYINLSRALVLTGDTKGGLASNQKALAMSAALLSGHPDNADYRRLLANTYQNDGDYRAILDDHAGALQSFRRKLVLDEQALADDPANAQARGDLAYTCERMGDLTARLGRYAEALSLSRRAQEIFGQLAAEQPQNLYLRYRGITIRASVGELRARLGQRSAALADSSAAIDLLGEIEEDPANSSQSGFRAEVYTSVAATHVLLAKSGNATATEQREHWRTARDMYGRSLEIWQDMQKRGILTAEDAAKPAAVEREIARLRE